MARWLYDLFVLSGDFESVCNFSYLILQQHSTIDSPFQEGGVPLLEFLFEKRRRSLT